MLADPSSAWCDDVATPAVETCPERIWLAFDRAVDDIAAGYGSEPAKWRWGMAHRARFAHPLFGRIPILRELLDPSIETGGGNDTISRGTAVRTDSPLAFAHVHGAGVRAIFDLDDPDGSRFMIATGQSGNPLSPHYADLMSRWRDGEFLTIVGAGDHVLTLQPRR